MISSGCPVTCIVYVLQVSHLIGVMISHTVGPRPPTIPLLNTTRKQVFAPKQMVLLAEIWFVQWKSDSNLVIRYLTCSLWMKQQNFFRLSQMLLCHHSSWLLVSTSHMCLLSIPRNTVVNINVVQHVHLSTQAVIIVLRLFETF